MEHRGPVMPSHRYSPVGEYTYGSQHDIIPPTRTPLGESTGNAQAQAHGLGDLTLCHQSQLSLSPPLQPIPTLPIFSTQPVSSVYGTSLRSRRAFPRDVSLRDPSMGHPRASRNPIHAWKYFSDYRAKVAQKEREGEEPKWPMYLEDAFLDAMMLVPNMGRQKYSSKGTLYGRNMLISEYLWIVYWLLFPPGPGEVVPVGKAREPKKATNGEPAYPGHPYFRHRKQVSSHIQVMKNFFTFHPVFHFFFPRKCDEREEARKYAKEEGETKSFKNNRVLSALAEGRLPDERPNYDYFARLLGADSEIFMRPKSCWIYVSHPGVTLSDDCRKAYTQLGKCLEADGIADNGARLELKGEFPHLVLNSNKDVRRDLQRDAPERVPTHLLHEYTKALTQTESGSVKDVSWKWERRFPELFTRLSRALDDTDRSHEQTARCVIGPCDIIHMDVVLDLHGSSKFPEGTSLNGEVTFGIGRADLLSHSWLSKTCVVKPRELYYGGPETASWNEPCELRPASTDTLKIPFPADSLAKAFVQLAKYVTADRKRAEHGGEPGLETAKGGGGGGGRTKASSADKTPTALSMLEQMAIYQEIWSAPNDGSSGGGGGERDWKRRTVVMWTFSNVRNKTEKDKVSVVPPGTSWRFLTKLDPASQYHQQRAYVPGTPNVSRDSVMSPDPGFPHHVSAAMHENLGSSYEGLPMTLPGQQQQQQQQQHHHHHPQQQKAHLTGLSLLETFPNGLVTPPPTACLPSNYAPSFDGATVASTESLHHHHHHHHPHHHPHHGPPLGYLSDASGSDGVGALVADAADSFLTGLVVPSSASSSGIYEESGPSAWTEHNPHHQHHHLHGLAPAVGSWTTTSSSFDSQPASLAWAAGGDAWSGGPHHHHHHHDDSPGPAPWTVVDDDKDGLWGPADASSAMGPDAWGAAPTTESWLSTAAPPSWDDDGNGPPPPSHQHHYREEGGVPILPSSHVTSIKQETGDGVTAAPPSSSTIRGRKRGRTDEDDDDNDDVEDGDGDARLPRRALRKLHHDDRAAHAPAAVMEEHGALFLQ